MDQNTTFQAAIRSTAAAILLTGIIATGPAFAQNKPSAAPATQPSGDATTLMNDVQASLDTKQFPDAVKAASKVLALHGPAAAGVNRFQMMMLKGYAQAGLKSLSSAGITFKLAMKETKDPREIALAKWTAELFKTAGATTFTPKTMAANGQKLGPYDLLDADQRKDAFSGFLDDQLALIEPKLKAATISQKLPEIYPVLMQVVDLDQLDVIANGNDDKTTALASGLLDHARNLLSNALKTDWARVGDIDSHANIVTTVPTQVIINNSMVSQTISKKNGLSDSNRSELQNIIAVCQKIHDAAETFLPLARSDKDWSTIISDSDRVAARASDVLNADYGTATSTGSNVTDNGSVGNGTGIGIGVGGTPLNDSPASYPGGVAPQQPQTANPGTPAAPFKPKPETPATPEPATPAAKPPSKLPGTKMPGM